MTHEIGTAVNHRERKPTLSSLIARVSERPVPLDVPEWKKNIWNERHGMNGEGCSACEVLSCWLLIAAACWMCAYVFTCRWLCNRLFSAVHLLCWFSITLLAQSCVPARRACVFCLLARNRSQDTRPEHSNCFNEELPNAISSFVNSNVKMNFEIRVQITIS